MKILCLIDWRPIGRWVWDYLPNNQDVVDFVTITMPPDRFPGYGKLFGYYPKYGWLGLKAFPRLNNYDVIVTWEGKNGVPLAFLRSLLGKSTPPLVILNFVLKGRVVLDALWFTKFALRSVNRLTCISEREIYYYSQTLDVPRERFVKLQGPWPDYASYMALDHQGDDFIFSAGRSHRDYHTLIESVRGLPVRVIINARKFNITESSLPDNVIVNPFLPFADFLNLVKRAKFLVVPLYEAKHASGESFMMTGMSMGKAVIATETYSTAELITPGVDGLLVRPRDPVQMRQAIEFLLQNPALVQNMGKAARQSYEQKWSFPVVAKQIQSVLEQVVDQQ